jgi:DNA-binding beta-propeller fold protein YncE
MQIKRLLDDRVVVTGDKLINSQGEHCEFVEHADGQLVAVSPDGEKVRNAPHDGDRLSYLSLQGYRSVALCVYSLQNTEHIPLFRLALYTYRKPRYQPQ